MSSLLKNNKWNIEKIERYLPCIIFVVAFVVRIWALGRCELWVDEINYATRSSPPLTPWGLFADRIVKFSSVPYMPLPGAIHNAFLWLCRLFCDDVLHNSFLQRMPAVLFGSATVPFCYLLGRRLLERKVALLAALMLCFFFFPFFYSREARFYAAVLFFTVVSVYMIIKILAENRMTLARRILLYVLLTATSLSMMNGVVVSGAVFLVSLGLIWNVKCAGEIEPVYSGKVAFGIFASSFLSLLTISPLVLMYIMGLLGNMVGQVGKELPYSFWVMLNDTVGKMFMGTRPWALLSAWPFLIMGIGSFMFRSEKKPLRRRFLFIVMTVVVVLALGVMKNKYYFARIFFLLTAFFYIIAADGMHSFARWVGKPFRRWGSFSNIIFAACGVLTICAQLYMYVIPGYTITSKHPVSYKTIVDWLNRNVKAGTPVIMDEPHEGRYIPGFYKPSGCTMVFLPKMATRGGVGSAVHGAPFRQFVSQFPNAVWVESWAATHHSLKSSTEMHKYFRRKKEFGNDIMIRLTAAGIVPHTVDPLMDVFNYNMPIWYNTPSDIEYLMKERGHVCVFDYSGWRCSPVARAANGQIIYAWVQPGTSLSVGMKSLSGVSSAGILNVRGVIAVNGGRYRITFMHGGKTLLTSLITGGQFFSLKSNAFTLPPDSSTLSIHVSAESEVPAGGARVLCLNQMDFVPGSAD